MDSSHLSNYAPNARQELTMQLVLFLEQESNSKQRPFSIAGDIPVGAKDHRRDKMSKSTSDGDEFCAGQGGG